LSSSEIADQAS